MLFPMMVGVCLVQRRRKGVLPNSPQDEPALKSNEVEVENGMVANRNTRLPL